jgi:hypothetical protein
MIWQIFFLSFKFAEFSVRQLHAVSYPVYVSHGKDNLSGSLPKTAE